MSRRGVHHASTLVVAIWTFNLIILAGLLAVLGLAWMRQPVRAAPVNASAQAPGLPPTPGPPPTRWYLPTVTPNPRSTPIEVVTPTPFVLANGPRPAIIGFSVSARPLEVYTFGQGERQRMIVAGIHGGYEWNTIALADQLIIYLNEHPQAIPSDVTLFILRNMNPDGDARAHGVDGRVNERGVDLNRNFPANWAAEWDRDGCWDYRPTTAGSYPGSEPETAAVMNFIRLHKIEALISYHSAALGIFPGGVPWEEDSKRLAQAIADVSTYPYPPIDTGCEYTGTLADWAVEQGAAAVDMELTNHRDTDFEMNRKILQVLVNWGR